MVCTDGDRRDWGAPTPTSTPTPTVIRGMGGGADADADAEDDRRDGRASTQILFIRYFQKRNKKKLSIRKHLI